jgi:cellulose synthase/poly-beta-1,6-N-acetylglucosamine synthase-like glycosyltransferase
LIEVVLAAFYILISVLLLPYGYNALFLVYASKLYNLPENEFLDSPPRVTVQLPVYNERYVVKRLLEAVFSFDWPRDKLEVLILDDSTDDTSDIIDSELEKYRSTGIDVEVIRRSEREGFKAGALQNGLNYTRGKYVAIFDADFVPPQNFLKETIPPLERDPRLALVQARWGHVNRDYNEFTEAFALGMDGHHLVEQTGRCSWGLPLHFNGTSGVIRTEAIEEAGGWSADTLNEDLDLSYRMQLKGWKAMYLRDLVVPGETPPNIPAFRNQQSRWAQGSIQCGRKLLGRVWRSPQFNVLQKIQATLHMTSYLVQPLILLMLLTTIPLILFRGYRFVPSSLPFIVLYGLCILSSISMYYSTVKRQGWSFIKNFHHFFFMTVLGFGLSVQITLSVLKGLTRYGGFFERTPKYDIKHKDDLWRDKVYKPLQAIPILEIILASYSLLGLYLAFINHQWSMTLYLTIYVIGFSLVAYYTHNHYRQYQRI